MVDSSTDQKLLQVDGLTVDFFTRAGTVHAVRAASFHVNKGETLGIVGESGSGKSVTAQAILGLTELPGKVVAGQVRWRGEQIIGDDQDAPNRIAKIRGREISMIFQDPMTSLNPVLTIGEQIAEVVRHHLKYNKQKARERAIELLDLVGISNPRGRVDQYPFELSGGMRQRVLIASALACEPALLIADEPTTALDVTIQAQILDLIADLQQQLEISVVLITHDLGVVAGVCDRVLVMYSGRIVEEANIYDLYAKPQHPYAQGLLRSTPHFEIDVERLELIPGSPPDMKIEVAGCSFAPRCNEATGRCRSERPTLQMLGNGQVACWNPLKGMQ
jgi:peptide/nickel transport system ATP-binding protein